MRGALRDNRHARKTQCKVETCPRRQLPSERRLPLRQPPAEQPFSASIRNWNPVSNDWVLPHLGADNFIVQGRMANRRHQTRHKDLRGWASHDVQSF